MVAETDGPKRQIERRVERMVTLLFYSIVIRDRQTRAIDLEGECTPGEELSR
jgi:hypothetical protein